MEWDQEEDGLASPAAADDGAPAVADDGAPADVDADIEGDDAFEAGQRALDDALFDADFVDAILNDDPFEPDPDATLPDDDSAEADPAADPASEDGDAPAALRRLRALTARHGTASLVIAAVAVLALVLGCFALVYGAVLSSVTVEKDAPADASEALQPVENHELPHLALRVTDISASQYPRRRDHPRPQSGRWGRRPRARRVVVLHRGERCGRRRGRGVHRGRRGGGRRCGARPVPPGCGRARHGAAHRPYARPLVRLPRGRDAGIHRSRRAGGIARSPRHRALRFKRARPGKTC